MVDLFLAADPEFDAFGAAAGRFITLPLELSASVEVSSLDVGLFNVFLSAEASSLDAGLFIVFLSAEASSLDAGLFIILWSAAPLLSKAFLSLASEAVTVVVVGLFLSSCGPGWVSESPFEFDPLSSFVVALPAA